VVSSANSDDPASLPPPALYCFPLPPFPALQGASKPVLIQRPLRFRRLRARPRRRVVPCQRRPLPPPSRRALRRLACFTLVALFGIYKVVSLSRRFSAACARRFAAAACATYRRRCPHLSLQ